MNQAAENVAPTAPLYTELPYPADGVVRTPVSQMLYRAVREHAPELLAKSDLRIVDVGCGTGESTAGLAKYFPQAKITAIDINPASLDMARKLADENHLPISFVQANITDDLRGTIQRAQGAAQF